MKKILLSLALFSVLSCSKEANKDFTEADLSETNLSSGPSPYVEPPVKKYAQIVCTINGQIGSACQNPGESCKKETDCIATTANKILRKLTNEEIERFANLDANYFLEQGYIDEESLQFVKAFNINMLKERNKSLPLK
ncbi:MAG: hypothetical protein JNN00_07200 [Chitinophagaceae bacterium]|nr:hypothetical protein [Chitinophagaceae bacterium]